LQITLTLRWLVSPDEVVVMLLRVVS